APHSALPFWPPRFLALPRGRRPRRQPHPPPSVARSPDPAPTAPTPPPCPPPRGGRARHRGRRRSRRGIPRHGPSDTWSQLPLPAVDARPRRGLPILLRLQRPAGVVRHRAAGLPLRGAGGVHVHAQGVSQSLPHLAERDRRPLHRLLGAQYLLLGESRRNRRPSEAVRP